jgi:hypothetical protein
MHRSIMLQNLSSLLCINIIHFIGLPDWVTKSRGVDELGNPNPNMCYVDAHCISVKPRLCVSNFHMNFHILPR